MVNENVVQEQDKEMVEVCRDYDISEQTYEFLKSRYPKWAIHEAVSFNEKREPFRRKVDELLFSYLGVESSLKVKVWLDRLRRRIAKLSTFRGWLGLLLRPILVLLGPHFFWHFQKILTRIEKRRFHWEPPNKEECLAYEIINKLKTDGIAFWPEMHLNEEFLSEALKESEVLLEKARKQLEGFPEGVGEIRDLSTGHRYVRDHPLDYAGRTRVRLEGWDWEGGEGMPKWMDYIVNDSRFLQVANNYFGVPATVKRFTIDELIPSMNNLEWHSDTVHDALKAYIFLKDCKLENGPTQFLIGSHRVDALSIRRTYYLMHKYGMPYCYPGPLYHVAPGEIKLGAGLAGDCFFFDPRGLHSAINCLTGKRIVLVVSFQISSDRNKMLSAVGTM